MNPMLGQCPVCHNAMAVTRLHCSSCETTLDGRFDMGPFAGLSPEQMRFVAAFVRCEGKLSHLEGELGMSYPTLRSRLHEVIKAMGFVPRAEAEAAQGEAAERRRSILDGLDSGEIDADEAMSLLRELGS